MQENRIIKILTLILGSALFTIQRDAVSAFIFFSTLLFYVTLSHSEARKNDELDSFKDDLKKLKDRVDSMTIQRAFK